METQRGLLSPQGLELDFDWNIDWDLQVDVDAFLATHTSSPPTKAECDLPGTANTMHRMTDWPGANAPELAPSPSILDVAGECRAEALNTLMVPESTASNMELRDSSAKSMGTLKNAESGSVDYRRTATPTCAGCCLHNESRREHPAKHELQQQHFEAIIPDEPEARLDAGGDDLQRAVRIENLGRKEQHLPCEFSFVSCAPETATRHKRGTYRCSHGDCGLHFSRRCDLQKHTRRKHGGPENRRYICTSCDRRFLYPKDLKRHALKVHPFQPEPRISNIEQFPDQDQMEPVQVDSATNTQVNDAWRVPTFDPFQFLLSDQDLLHQPFDLFDGTQLWDMHTNAHSNDTPQALQHLYGAPDDVDLYPGLMDHTPTTARSRPAPAYTASRSVLSDAVALVRGDRFYNTTYSPSTLVASWTNWPLDSDNPVQPGSYLGWNDNSTHLPDPGLLWDELMDRREPAEDLHRLSDTLFRIAALIACALFASVVLAFHPRIHIFWTMMLDPRVLGRSLRCRWKAWLRMRIGLYSERRGARIFFV